jgi:hypothetical protein
MKRGTNLPSGIAPLLLATGVALLLVSAQGCGRQQQAYPMSAQDMMSHMNGMMGRIHDMTPAMQGNQSMAPMMESMGTVAGDLNRMTGQIQNMMSNPSIMQSPDQKQDLDSMRKNLQDMIQSMDAMLGDMDQMQKHR